MVLLHKDKIKCTTVDKVFDVMPMFFTVHQSLTSIFFLSHLTLLKRDGR